jgi:proteic killer suppression protein
MIVSFRDTWLEQFYRYDKRSKHIPADAEGRLFRKLQLIDDAITDLDLRTPPSNHFEKLKGNLQDWHSIRVTGSWRLIFQWNGAHGEASKVYLDNHSYR